MTIKFLSVKEAVEPIVGGYWGETVELGAGNARVVRNGDVLESGEIGPKVPERKLSEKEITKSRLQSGDILITMSGNVGRVARVKREIHDDGNPYVASNFVKILRAKEEIMPEYLFFLLRGAQFQNDLKKYTRGVAIQNLSVKAFDQKIIPVIPKKEQERIVVLLEEAEELKRKRAQANQKMSTVIPALFNKMFDRTNWPAVKLGEIATVKIGPFGTQLHAHDYVTNGIPLVNPTHIVDGRIEVDSNLTISDHKMKELSQYVMHTGDVVLARRGEMGRCALVSSKEDGYLCGTGSLFITPSEKINPLFLSTLLSSPAMRKQLEENARGVTMKNLNINVVGNLKVQLPPINLQNEYAERVNEIHNLEKVQRGSAANINSLFSSLLAGAFTN